jgi:hypothetical protein
MTRRAGDTTLPTNLRSTINFDEVAWSQIHEMAEADGLCLSAMIRVLVRAQYKQRQKMEQISQ